MYDTSLAEVLIPCGARILLASIGTYDFDSMVKLILEMRNHRLEVRESFAFRMQGVDDDESCKVVNDREVVGVASVTGLERSSKVRVDQFERRFRPNRNISESESS